MELVEVALLVAAFIAFAITDTWYYRVHRPRREARKAAEAHLDWALRRVQAGDAQDVDTATLEALLGLTQREIERRKAAGEPPC